MLSKKRRYTVPITRLTSTLTSGSKELVEEKILRIMNAQMYPIIRKHMEVKDESLTSALKIYKTCDDILANYKKSQVHVIRAAKPLRADF